VSFCKIWHAIFVGSYFTLITVQIARFKQVLASFSKYILRDESRVTTNSQLTEKIVSMMVDRPADVTRVPRQLQDDLLDELRTASESKVYVRLYTLHFQMNLKTVDSKEECFEDYFVCAL